MTSIRAEKLAKGHERFHKNQDKEYDRFYRSKGVEDPTEPLYAGVWDVVLSWIRDDEAIGDFGCGTGRFARLALERGKKYVFGFDYSSVAIQQARVLNPEHPRHFVVGDLRHRKWYTRKDYDVGVFLEVFEHLENDCKAFSFIPMEKRIIASFPSFDYLSHYRFFNSVDECLDRYSALLKVSRHKEVALPVELAGEGRKIWILEGVRHGKN